ncbi:MAG TPA: LysE family transporter [Chitinophagales bacterium]|nr:LysE family transporter [Chitinophagales bacterium]
MFEAVWQGIATGLILATLIGPISFAVIDLGLRGNVKGAAYIAFGTFISDILWVLFIYLLAKQVNRESMLLQAMYIAGGLVLIIMGLQNLLKAKITEEHPETERKNQWDLFVKGFMINSTNPNVFFFWFGAVMVAVKQYANQPHLVLTHFFSALLIVFSTDFLKGYAASFLRPYLRQNTLMYLSRLSGIILIGFGLKLIVFH